MIVKLVCAHKCCEKALKKNADNDETIKIFGLFPFPGTTPSGYKKCLPASVGFQAYLTPR